MPSSELSAKSRPTALRWFLNLLNSGQVDGAPVEVLYINAVTLIGLVDISTAILIEHSIDNNRLALFMGFIVLCGIINLIFLRITLNAAQASNNILLIVLVMLCVMLLDGMFQQTALIWFASFPAIAFFFKGKSQGLLWLGALLGLLLLIMLAQSASLLHSPFGNGALALLVLSTITIGMFVYVYESIRTRNEASLQLAREQLHRLAHNDPLTGLPNRTAFYELLPQALNQADKVGNRLAVLFIDLDNFKPINDTYGHETGDLLLAETAQRLRETLRGNDFLARIGGDEFTAILPGITDKKETGVVADKLIHALENPFTILGHECRIGVSIGIGLYPDCASTVDGLVQLADHAMYAAKVGGKNSYALCPISQTDEISPYKGQQTCNKTCLLCQGG